MRYDRQIRIWETSGQSKIENSNILCIGEGFLMWETLKNLILGGFGNLFLIESAWAVKKKQQLQNFNPSVNLSIVSQNEINIDHIDLLVSLNNLSNIHIPPSIPRIDAYSNGWYGYINISHSGYICQKREKHVDLMLVNPFPSLSHYLEQWDLNSLDDYAYSHVPYPVLLSKLKSISTNRKELKHLLNSFIKEKVDMDNIQEAIDNVYYKYKINEYPDVKELFHKAIPKANKASQVIHGISLFFNKYQRLPVSLEIPDIKSTTEGYLQLKKVYNDQFIKDCLEIQALSGVADDAPFIQEWCKNIRDLKWIQPQIAKETPTVTLAEPFDVQTQGLELYSFLKQHLLYRLERKQFPTSFQDINCTGSIIGYYLLIINVVVCAGVKYMGHLL